MITEIATLVCTPGRESDLKAAFVKARVLFNRAKGCKGVVFRRSIETPERYLVIVDWETIENHTLDFQKSEDYQTWRALVTPCLTTAPVAEHCEHLK